MFILYFKNNSASGNGGIIVSDSLTVWVQNKTWKQFERSHKLRNKEKDNPWKKGQQWLRFVFIWVFCLKVFLSPPVARITELKQWNWFDRQDKLELLNWKVRKNITEKKWIAGKSEPQKEEPQNLHINPASPWLIPESTWETPREPVRNQTAEGTKGGIQLVLTIGQVQFESGRNLIISAWTNPTLLRGN